MVSKNNMRGQRGEVRGCPGDRRKALVQAVLADGVRSRGSGCALGGLIGLGGAEFRLPLLISLFGFAALSAVILNKAMSLVVVLTALPARLAAVSVAELSAHWLVAANLLAGSLIGAWVGAV